MDVGRKFGGGVGDSGGGGGTGVRHASAEPSILLDILLATSITASVLVLLSAVHILRPTQFSVFPSLLLLLTLFRLSLNLASSRRILLHGNEGASAAGRVIEAFGQFVVGGTMLSASFCSSP